MAIRIARLSASNKNYSTMTPGQLIKQRKSHSHGAVDESKIVDPTSSCGSNSLPEQCVELNASVSMCEQDGDDGDDNNDSSSIYMSRISVPSFVMKATGIASLGGILFGYDLGVISGALPQLSTDLNLTETQQQWVVGILYLGAGMGAAVGGYICDTVGRKLTILLTDIVFIVGALLLFLAGGVEQIMIGRVVVGVAVSISGIADVAYLHEMAPIHLRGAIVSVNEACISLGFLIAFCCGMFFQYVTEGWRHMFGISGYLALAQLTGMLYMPESPVWLKQQGREREADEALQVIYGDVGRIPTFDHERIQELKPMDEIAAENSCRSLAVSRVDLYDTLGSPGENLVHASSYSTEMKAFIRLVSCYRRQISIALFLSVTQQLSGQASVLNYAPLIFMNLDHTDLSTTLWIGVVKFCVTVLVIWRIEYMGRRFLLLFGMLMIAVGQFLLAFAFTTVGKEETIAEAAMAWALLGVLCVVFGYSFSFGPLTWLLTSELFPTDIRGRALGFSSIMSYLCATLVTSTFLSMQSAIGSSTVFVLYGSVAVLGMVFAYLAIPDTGGKTAEQIGDELNRLWWWRQREELILVDRL